ncbi:hypothetical protein PQX77_000802 [Marasmius sp. AFHP31]|nr:hypothetical protein PQX77_000802 [Marasmius sp. AFHP31]
MVSARIQKLLNIVSLVVVVSAGVQLENSDSSHEGCVAASSKNTGAPVIYHDCLTGDASNYDWDIQDFPVDPTPQQVKLFGTDLASRNACNKCSIQCLDVKDGLNADGTKLQLWTCTSGNTNQLWSHTSSLGTWQWAGTNKCIDLTDGLKTDGNPIQIWTCDSSGTNRNQMFPGRTVPDTQSVVVTLVNGNDVSSPTALCLTASDNQDGARVSLAPCNSITSTFPSGNATWVVPRSELNGIMSTYGGSKCLDLTGGSLSDGTPLQIWSCDAGNPNQAWRVNGLTPKISPLIFKSGSEDSNGAGGKCAVVKDGNSVAGVDIQLGDCNSSNNATNWFIPRQ